MAQQKSAQAVRTPSAGRAQAETSPARNAFPSRKPHESFAHTGRMLHACPCKCRARAAQEPNPGKRDLGRPDGSRFRIFINPRTRTEADVSVMQEQHPNNTLLVSHLPFCQAGLSKCFPLGVCSHLQVHVPLQRPKNRL